MKFLYAVAMVTRAAQGRYVNRPVLSVSAAVEAFEVERRTLQRMLAAGQLDGATKDKRGRWSIPVEALHAAGFGARQTWKSVATNSAARRDSDATTHDSDATKPIRALENTERDSATRDATNSATPSDSDATDLRQRIARLEAQLEYEQQLREAAEQNTNDLSMSLRMLDAGPSAEQPARRRWWRRD